MKATIIPIKRTRYDAYMVECPETEKLETEKRCAHCPYLRIMEEKVVKCNYKNIIEQNEKLKVTGI